MTQELYLLDPELIVAKLLMVSKSLEHNSEMLFCSLQVHKDVINEFHVKLF
jgi:hypothetical protein